MLRQGSKFSKAQFISSPPQQHPPAPITRRYKSTKRKRSKLKKSLTQSKKEFLRTKKAPPPDKLSLPSAADTTVKTAQRALDNFDATTLQSALQAARGQFREYAHSLASPQHERALRTKLVMDYDWWKWNLLLMISPSLLLASYCQYAKPEAMAYHKAQKMEERRRIMGEDWNEEVEKEVEELELLEMEGEQRKVWRVLVESGQVLLGKREEVDKSREVDEVVVQAAVAPIQTPTAVAPPPPTTSTPTTPSTNDTIEIKLTSENQVIASLLSRIERMEHQLQTQSQEETPKSKAQIKKYLLERSNQSPIQNRAEDRAMNDWRKEREERQLAIQRLKEGSSSTHDGSGWRSEYEGMMEEWKDCMGTWRDSMESVVTMMTGFGGKEEEEEVTTVGLEKESVTTVVTKPTSLEIKKETTSKVSNTKDGSKNKPSEVESQDKETSSEEEQSSQEASNITEEASSNTEKESSKGRISRVTSWVTSWVRPKGDN